MTLPVTGPALLPLGIVFGFAFGWLLQRARIADTDVIIAQLRLRDYTLFKVMLTAIIVGGVGIFFLHSGGLAAYHVKPANLAAVAVGAVLFGVGMALYGYCPGTGLAAIGTGSVHALIGAIGMIAGAIAFGLVRLDQGHAPAVAAYGQIRLPDLTGIPDLVWLAAIAAVGFAALFVLDGRRHV